MQESLPVLVSRFTSLKQNGAEAHGKCPFHADEGESLRVGDTWRCVACCEQEINGTDGIGFLMSWSGCSRAEAEHQLSNGGLPEVIPIQVPPLKKLPFWGGPFLNKMPDARVWIHDSGVEGVHAGRDFYPMRVHLGITYKADLSDVSQLTQPKLRECILLPRNVESSLERMDALAAALYAAGHKVVKWIDPRGQEDNWAWPLGMGKDEAVKFAKKHVLTYPNNAAPQENEARVPSVALAGPMPAPATNAPATAAPPNAAPDPAPASPSSSQGLDRGAASDTPKDSLGPRLERKRGNGQAGPPLTPSERASAYAEATKAELLGRIVSCKASSITLRATDWLWPGKIPLGEICVIQGDPGLGKSQITASLAAIITTGGQWPVTREQCKVGSVIILSAEDSMAKTIVPRLAAAGADLERVTILQAIKHEHGTRGFSLLADMLALDTLLGEEDNPMAVIVDPISAYQDTVGMGVKQHDSHKNTDVRSLLRPVSELVDRRNVTMILINHLTKGTGRAITRGQGNMAFVAGPRAVWQVSKDKDDPRKRLFLPVKNNLADDSEETGLSFGVEAIDLGTDAQGKPIRTSRIMWNDERVTITADEAAGYDSLTQDERGSVADAEEFLRDALGHGPAKVKDVERLAKLSGHSSATLGRAKRAMQVKSVREGFGPSAIWYWKLPATSGAEGMEELEEQEPPPRWDDPR